MKKLKFDELNLSERILRAVADMGFEEASPIQSETIPVLLNGKDLIGQAQTGTGKTAAFAIPIIDKIDFEAKELQALVLCPTRELVIQVTEEFRRLTKYFFNLAIVPVYGGQEIERQINALKKKPQVVIGTPGRLMDHMRRGTVKLDKIKFVVLDEADEMLDMGFREDMEVILKDTPAERQTIMFSATMPDDIVALTRQFQKNPVRIDVTCHKINAPKIEQFYYELLEKSKPEALARLIDFYGIKLALVFCNTKMQVDNLVEVLKSRGYLAEALHGDLNQRQRDKVMSGFRSGIVEVLVATDVAGRGIDVNDVEAVFNYDLPRDDEDYVHRIGRTARAGKTGKAFTFIVGRQIYNLKRIERANGLKITCHQIPSLSDLDETRLKFYSNKIREVLQKGGLSKYIGLIENLMGDEYTTLDIAAALLKLSMGEKLEASEEIEEVKHKYRYDKEQEYHKNFDRKDGEDRYDRNRRRDEGFDKNRPKGRDFGGKPYGDSFERSDKSERAHGNSGGGRSEGGYKDKGFDKNKSFDKGKSFDRSQKFDKGGKYGKNDKYDKYAGYAKNDKAPQNHTGDKSDKNFTEVRPERSEGAYKDKGFDKNKSFDKGKKYGGDKKFDKTGSFKFKTKKSSSGPDSKKPSYFDKFKKKPNR